MIIGRLLAHELGHLFGSDHDGMKAKNPHSIYASLGKYVFCLVTFLSFDETSQIRSHVRLGHI